jgi:hypothetical protein
VQEGANGLEVDVDDAVGFGQQACGFRRGLGAQEDSHGQQEQDRGHYPERSAGASVHCGAVRDTVSLGGSGFTALASSCSSSTFRWTVPPVTLRVSCPICEASLLDDDLMAFRRAVDTVEGVLPTNAPSTSISAPGGVESTATDACAGDGGGAGRGAVAGRAGRRRDSGGLFFRCEKSPLRARPNAGRSPCMPPRQSRPVTRSID